MFYKNSCLERLKMRGKSDDEWGSPGAPLDISWPITISPQEPWVQLMVGNRLIDFLVDTGATYSVLKTKLTKKSLDAVTIIKMTGQFQKQVFLQPLEGQLADQKLMYSFLYMPDYSIPLLNWDLLCKLHAQITFFLKAAIMCRDPTGTYSPALGTPNLPGRSWRWTLPCLSHHWRCMSRLIKLFGLKEPQVRWLTSNNKH